MPSFLFFFLFVSVLRPTSFAQTQTKQDREYYEACVNSSSISCGDKTFPISYPFLVEGRDSNCGDPDYTLRCSDDNNTIISIDSTDYLVKDISYNPDALTVAPMTTINTSDRNCSRLFRNTTLDWNLFSYTDQTVNLTLYSCPSSIPSTNPGNEITCSENSTTWLYTTEIFFSDADIPTLCTSTITVAVLRTAADNFSEGWNWDSFSSALTGGFQVNWNAGTGSCSSCTESGGVCGYNYTTSNETCYNRPPGHGGLTPWQIFLIALSVFGFVVIVAIVAVCFKCSRRRKLKDDDAQQITSADSLLFSAVKDDDAQQIISADSLLFDSATINLVTENFSESNKLGQGGFGVVYKGILPNKQEIAVKLLSSSSNQGMEELRNEVSLLAKLKHKNLVQLLGFCVEGQDKCLIYAYVNNQSLDKFFLDPVKRERLCWEKRYKIIKGIARGMLYLHEESHVKIIHRDLKASNILLDSDMNPKISDFGLARMFDVDQTKEMTRRIAGTFGYMAPEYVTNGHFSNKSDVFSFGVLVLEILMGQRNSNFNRDGNEATNLLTYVWENWRKRAISSIVDPSLGMNYAMDEALRCVEIGLLCVQESPNDRITMATVVLMLNNCPISVTAPSRPAFLFDCRGNETFNIDTKRDEDQFDRNELSITELGVR